jgi:hypothetical protein
MKGLKLKVRRNLGQQLLAKRSAQESFLRAILEIKVSGGQSSTNM